MMAMCDAMAYQKKVMWVGGWVAITIAIESAIVFAIS